MSEIIENPTIENITENKKEIMQCYKCQIKILKKYGSFKICQDCRNILAKKYYNEIVKPKKLEIKLPKIKKTKELDYITTNGLHIKVKVKSENKICKKCLENKNY